MKWFLKVLNQYFDFAGRARRKEYWMFVLFCFLFSIIAGVLDGLFGLTIPVLETGVLGLIVSLALMIPNLAVSVRRLHDTGRSGFMFFIILIPVIGWIWFVVLLATDSNPGANEYGEYPKEEIA